MQLIDILILVGCFVLLAMIPRNPLRNRLLLLSVIFLFRLQPAVPIRNFDFWFPLLTVGITFFVWRVCGGKIEKNHRVDFTVILGTILLTALTRFFELDGLLTRTRPPQPGIIIAALCVGGLILWLSGFWARKKPAAFLSAGILLLLLLLILLKTPALSLRASMFLRTLSGQSAENAGTADLRWLGFSYIAFRLLSVMIDARHGRRPEAGPGDFLIYVIFPPALSAGPIDRPEHFQRELNAVPGDIPGDFLVASERIGIGLFKKFILADSLAKMALSPANVMQLKPGFWAWAALFFYGFQLYFDFSGYSDIAIGLARIIGISLPENFRQPYLKPDIAKFWNNWHITLTQWIRTYVFNPLTRRLRARKQRPLPQWLMILVTQLVTMLLIGLWHGISINFALWGLWHGIGLFIHQLYERRTKGLLFELSERNRPLHRFYTGASTILTIFFVMIGWVWFALPDFDSAVHFMTKLF